jgi:xanthine/uracil permease
MVVTPILQLSLVFRLFLSQLINRDHEVMNNAVLIGAFTAVLGSILVSLDTDELTGPWDCHHRWPTSCATASAATVPEGREGYFPHWKLKATGVIMPEERLPWGQTIISGMQHGVAMAGEGSAVPMQPLDRELARAAAILCC